MLILENVYIPLQFNEEDYILRTPAHHDFFCSLLDGPLATFDSTTYGVNSCSPLNQIDNFHVANGQLATSRYYACDI